MKNLNKFIAYILTIFIIFASNSKADDNILPLPRPEIDESVLMKCNHLFQAYYS